MNDDCGRRLKCYNNVIKKNIGCLRNIGGKKTKFAGEKDSAKIK